MATDDKRNIYERMQAVMLAVPAIGKNKRNQEQKFNFRSVDDVLDALQPLLAKHGLFYVPDVIERIHSTHISSSNKVWNDVSLHVRFTFYGLAGDSFVASGWGEGSDSADKATNKAMTGAMKYVLNQVFAIPFSGSEDGDASAPEPQERAQATAYQANRPIGTKVQDNPLPDGPFATKEQQSAITDYFAAFEQDLEEALKRAGVKSVSNLTETTAAKWIDRFKELESEKAPA